MVQPFQQSVSGGTTRPVIGALVKPDALAQADRVAAETLIRSTVQILANGSAIKDLDGLVQRNAGSVSHTDVRAGRLGSNVLGDIISTVEQAKGGSAFNWHSAPPEQIKAYLVANGYDPAQAQRLMGASAERQAAAREDSGARFDSMAAAKGDWGSPAGQAYMRDYAVKHGLSWATNNVELLRLGPAAIDALAEARLRQDTYQRLTKEAGFTAKDVVTLSRFAKEKNVDANELGGTIADVNKELGKQERDRHNKALLEFISAKPEQAEAAQEKLHKVQDDLVRANPALAPKIEKERNILKQKKGEEAAKRVESTATKTAADAQQVKADAKETQIDNTRARMEEILKKRQAAQGAKVGG